MEERREVPFSILKTEVERKRVRLRDLAKNLSREKSSPGSLKSCCALESPLHQDVGQGNECSPTLSLAPFIGQQTGTRRDETTGSRSHHGLVTKQGIT